MIAILNILLCFLVIAMSFGLCVQIAARREPFKSQLEQTVAFVAVIFWITRPLSTIIGILGKSFAASEITVLNWIATAIFLGVFMRALANVEGRAPAVTRGSNIMMSDRTFADRLAEHTLRDIKDA